MGLAGNTGDAIGGDGLAGRQGAASTIGTDLAETWCACARPASYGDSGSRTSFVSQGRDIPAADRSDYTASNPPHAGAAFASGGNFDGIAEKLAAGTAARDGSVRKQVN